MAYLCQGRNHEIEDGHAASAFAEEGDVVGIAVKELDVLLDPLQGQNLITETQISRSLKRNQ